MLKLAVNAFFHVLHPPTRALNFVQESLNQGDLAAATEKIEIAKRLFPDRSDVNELFARVYAKRGEWGKVQSAIEQIAADPSARFTHIVEAARLFRKLGDEEKAIELFRQAGENSRGWKAGATWNPIGHIYLQRGDNENALNAFAEGVCREGPAVWTTIIAALQDCSLDVVAECREKMLKRRPRKKRAYQYHKMLSLLEQNLSAGGRIDEMPMFQSIRTACELSFKRLYPRIKTDESESPLKPSFLVIGAMKCGTTTLFDLIAQHPKCLAPIEKELQFFQFPHLSDQWYLEHFPRINPSRGFITGDASPGYYIFDIVDRVHQLLPHVKLIFIQRDPAQRAMSHVRHNSQVGLEEFEPQQAIAGIDELELEIASAPQQAEQTILEITYQKRPHNNFVALGCYELLLRRWKKVFGPEQLLILELDDLSCHPQETMKRVFGFLGLEPIKVKPVNSNQGRYDNSDPQTQQALSRLERFYERVSQLTDNVE